MKQVKIISINTDPDSVTVGVKGSRYIYETSEFIIRKFEYKLEHHEGLGFHALGWLEKNSYRVFKEESDGTVTQLAAGTRARPDFHRRSRAPDPDGH